jgi:hypothetical protein
MKGCHYCAGERMLVKVTIPLDRFVNKNSEQVLPNPQRVPDVKPIVIVQCPRCMRIETDDEA